MERNDEKVMRRFRKKIRVNAPLRMIVLSRSGDLGFSMAEWQPFANHPVRVSGNGTVGSVYEVKSLHGDMNFQVMTELLAVMGHPTAADFQRAVEQPITTVLLSSERTPECWRNVYGLDNGGTLEVRFESLDPKTSSITVIFTLTDEGSIIRKLLANETIFMLSNLKTAYEAKYEASFYRPSTLN